MKGNGLVSQVALVIAVVCGVFSLFVAFQLVSNCIATTNADPLNMEVLGQLRLRLQQEPNNDILKQEIRDLDVLTRRTFFSSVSFQDNGVLILLVSAIITLVALKILSKLHARVPDPGKYKAGDESVETALLSRNAIWTAFGLIIALAVIAGLQSASRLEQATANVQQPTTNIQRPTPNAQPPTFNVHEVKGAWPNLRGPYGLGIAATTNAPVDWDGGSGRNILWKTPVPRNGFSSPIAVDGRVFLSCGDASAREVVCFNAGTGAIAWRKPVGVVPGAPAGLPEITDDVTFAASTMATDGERVFALFATGNVICFDLDGNRKWARNVGPFSNSFGHSASLIAYRDILVLQLDEAERGRLLALGTKDGKTVWETKRNVTVSWSTPVLARLPGGTQLVLNGNPLAAGYEPGTGKELWTYECMGGEVAPSPAYANGLVYVTTEYQMLHAIKPATPAEAAWEADGDLPDVSSPLATDDFLFTGSSAAVISCYDAKTGDLLWTHDADEGAYSSPVMAGGNVYLLDKSGRMQIFEAAREYKPVGQPELGEESSCTPAFTDNRIFIRGNKNLYCIGAR